ncbi:flagellar filament capping protein FliD [Parahaliea mediterranea]|uniref:Flagellar hook-associated protein 2 n=1 Tax=Parahaliea mediterranea TaxID=651086 RepID=A0A939DDC8_9GAMM|nr:flagellar filament capping protein FliD [Parahaliea mediterranea]MBN7795821.1 flagellar filament capping protein FliD [Parahaliea mediterranea]
MASIASLGVGSGLDLSGLLNQLEAAERKQLVPIVSQQKSHQAKISAFGVLEGVLEQFQTTAAKLSEADFFSSVTSSVTGDAATVSAGSEAMPGSYQIDITQRARGYSIATAGVADREANLGAGTITLDLQNGESMSVDIGAGDSSLEAIRDAINDAQGPVAASIVNDGSGTPHRLVLSSRETGTDNAIAAVDFGALAGSLAVDAGTEVTARNAELTVNGIAIQSQSNTVEGAIQGVTLEVEETGQVEVELRRDDSAIKSAVTAFVNNYNALQKTINTLTSYDADSGTAGTLLGNNTLRSIESRLRSGMSHAVEGGDIALLSDIGIELQKDGTLKLDDEALGELLADNPAGLADFFAGEDGFAVQMDSVVEAMVEESGLIEKATEGLSSSIERLGQRYDRMEQSIATTIERYRSQFGRLDSMIASMNSTSAYLTQQFDMMNAQLGRK